MKLVIAFSFCFVACTSKSIHDRYEMLSLLKCIPISKDYKLCDSLNAGADNCYLTFLGKRYLKRERIRFDQKGMISEVDVFKSEGLLQYLREDFEKDSLLINSNAWEITGTMMRQGDSIISPFKGLIIHEDPENKLIYSTGILEGTTGLYVASY